jgi:lipid-A-disaccharide synthase
LKVMRPGQKDLKQHVKITRRLTSRDPSWISSARLPSAGYVCQNNGMRIVIIAGEASGDQLGARLLADLRALQQDLTVMGVGGEALAAQGLKSLFPMSDLSLMGLAEVLPKIPLILRRIKQTAKAITAFAPDIVITIDAPDFSKRLARRLQPLRRRGAKLVHYVAPTVWVWRPGRAKIMAKLFDHLLCLFPFEPPYFEKVGLPTSFVGHPLAMLSIIKGDAGRLRQKLGIRADQPVLCLLPGSRAGEVRRLLPVFLETFHKLKKQNPEWVAILPTLENLKPLIGEIAPKGVHILTGPQDKLDAFALTAEQGGAIAASGTVSLELAAQGCPHVIAYIMHPLTYWIARAVVKTPFVNLINILAGRAVIPEILQREVTSEKLLSAFEKCYIGRMTQVSAFNAQLEKLAPPAPDAAARAVLGVLHD